MQEQYEVVAEFTGFLEAQLAAGRLEAEGIEAVVENRGALGTPTLNPGRLGGVTVLVRSEDAEVARVLLDVLEEDYEPEVPEEFLDDAEHLKCPECGSTEKKFQAERPVMKVLPKTSRSPKETGHRWVCKNCRHIWIVERQS